MNTAIIGALLANPYFFFLKVVVEPLPVAVVVYCLVLLVMRPKDGRRVMRPFLYYSVGLAATVAGSSIFRVISILTFAGRDAFEVTPGTIAGQWYFVIVPGIVAAGYIAWLKSQLSIPPTPVVLASQGNDAYAAAIGEKNQGYYLDKFEEFDQKGPSLHTSWNWAAFFGGGAWALYRKMYGWFFGWWVVATAVTIFSKVPDDQLQQVLTALVLVSWVGFSVFANALYHRKIKARIAAADRLNSDASRVSRSLRASSGVLIWVPIVFGGIPIIGIVAAVALPAFQDYTKRTQNVAGVAAAKPADEPAAQVDWNKGVITPPAKQPPVQAERGPWEQYQYQDGVAASKRGDRASAAVIFHPLAEAGHSGAQFSLGSMYQFGNGVPKDYITSAKWYRLAANQGHAVAQSQLGMMYEAGEGVLQNYAEAVKLYRMAATQGDSTSQSQLGIAYLMGRGVQQDHIRAHMWFNLAGVSDASGVSIQNRDTVANSMTPQQIAQAQQMARECQQRNFQSCD